MAAAHEPSSAELKAWFEKNSSKFALPSRYSFRHIYFSPDKRGQNAQADAAAALPRITGQPENSALALSLGCRGVSTDWQSIDARSAAAVARAGLELAAFTFTRRGTLARLERLGVVAACVEGAALDAS